MGVGAVRSFCRGYFGVVYVDVYVLDSFGFDPVAGMKSRVVQGIRRLCFVGMWIVCCVCCEQVGLCDRVSRSSGRG